MHYLELQPWSSVQATPERVVASWIAVMDWHWRDHLFHGHRWNAACSFAEHLASNILGIPQATLNHNFKVSRFLAVVSCLCMCRRMSPEYVALVWGPSGIPASQGQFCAPACDFCEFDDFQRLIPLSFVLITQSLLYEHCKLSSLGHPKFVSKGRMQARFISATAHKWRFHCCAIARPDKHETLLSSTLWHMPSNTMCCRKVLCTYGQQASCCVVRSLVGARATASATPSRCSCCL